MKPRPAYEQMLQDLASDKIDSVVVWTSTVCLLAADSVPVPVQGRRSRVTGTA